MLDHAQRLRVDRAYLGQAFLALALGWAGCFSWFDFTTAQALGFLTGVPIALLALTGVILATVYSIKLWPAWGEEKGLPILLAVPLVIVTALVAAARMSPNGELAPWQSAFLFLHPLIALPVIFRWFAIARKRHATRSNASLAAPV